MQLLIENTLTAQTEVKELVNQDYRIGHAKDCEIVVVSRFVSRYNALIAYSRKGFTLQLIGANSIYVNDLEVRRDESVTLAGGDRIRIGEYVLSVISSESKRAESATRNLDLAKKFAELEVKLHDELLQRLDLRKTNLAATRSDEHMQLVHQHLTALLNEHSFHLDPEVEDYVIRESLKMELTDRITIQGNKRRSGLKRPEGYWSGEHGNEAERIKSILASDLNLSSDANEQKENVQKIETHFDESINHHWLGISVGLKRYLLKQRIRKDIHDIIFGLGPLRTC